MIQFLTVSVGEMPITKYQFSTIVRKQQALQKLYETIADKFPFLAKQGLMDSGSPTSLDHLLSMTIFSQPKMGKK